MLLNYLDISQSCTYLMKHEQAANISISLCNCESELLLFDDQQ